MIVVGIVGAPAGGKSTVAKCLQELGATWINADLVARNVLEQAPVQAQLLRHFGPQIADGDGKINRSKLAQLVFGDDDESQRGLQYLESVLHPPTRIEITRRLREAESAGVQVAVLDVPLLFESKWDRSCDEVWCVKSTWAHRLQRAQQRGWDEAELRKRESKQLAMEQKCRLSQRVLTNDRGLDDLCCQVRQNWDILTHSDAHYVTDAHCQDP
ncbi:dephospho-CoA kinase [Novipirellula artificiosorum]|uniref:Dephospho-CoA kinase n=1 Tax=Novipirellula artificiosorum TaxID=2528016 RepID=A0A5C6DY17_9BACT|nr:dephospho-CoA kinase [Novipirellula artificiosorum]TWU42333.1 Dephospho-CoA kinase [Novipirellula artificiosorum]